ncbi:MAG: hypothetical protein M1830_005882 [Pleopsidium flavum]|nr:MAG: hypothetical protein M1830_005882 [Pleopsidium flavum]
MDRSVAQALTGLVPTLDGPLPTDLVELAVSLVAQSRSKASSLKAEEEIARSYACANIACERLKRTLNLPKIQPRPPCPPRVYQKLYRYLDKALPAHTRRSERPPKASLRAITPVSSPAKSQTPSKITPYKPVTPRKRGLQYESNSYDIPSWIMPTIRQLCTALHAPAAPPHVLAGLTSILTLPPPHLSNRSRATAVETKKDKIPALITAVYLFVAARLSGEETTSEDYIKQRNTVMDALQGVKVGREGREAITGRDVDLWVREIGNMGWQTLDWFANIGEGTGLGLHGDDEADENDEDMGDVVEARTPLKHRIEAMRAPKRDTLQAGLGTMVGVHMLVSCERRADSITDAG